MKQPPGGCPFFSFFCMIARIVPLKKLPPGATFFDYAVPEALARQVKPGQLVAIPFRNQKTAGIVFDVASASARRGLKEMHEILSDPAVDHDYFSLMQWFARYYFTSWSTFFHTFFPDRPKRLVASEPYRPSPPSSFLSLFPSRASLRKKSFKVPSFDKKKITLLLVDSRRDRSLFILSACARAAVKKERVVVFFPTHEDLSLLFHQLPKRLQRRVIIVTGELNKTQYWNAWHAILRGEYTLIFATRIGVFFPFFTPTETIIDQSEHASYKQADMNPRYSFWQVLLQRVRRFPPSQVTALSLSPKIEHYTHTKTARWHLVDLQKNLRPIHILDIANVSFASSEHPLLHPSLVRAVGEKKRTFVYLNRKGSFTSFMCRDCRWHASCPRCGEWLKLYVSKKQLVCHRCAYAAPQTLACPRCRGTSLTGVGVGVNDMFRTLKKLFPSHALVRVDKGHADIPHIGQHEKAIIIGTDYALPRVDFSSMDMVVFLNADIDLLPFDFRSTERTYHKYQSLLRSVPSRATALVQTRNPEHPFLKLLTRHYDFFWKDEIRKRKRYSYPPYVKLMKLIYSDYDQHKVKDEVAKVYRDIRRFSQKDFVVLPPLEGALVRQHRRYYSSILIKYKKEIPAELWERLPKNWVVDHDPETI